MTEKQAKLEKRNKEIVELILKGQSYRKLAKAFGLSYQSIANVKTKYIPTF